MREPKYLSPSAYLLYERSVDQYVQKYIAEPYLERDPQTRAMALGSGFDAYVKTYLSNELNIEEPFHLETLFNKQVDDELHTEIWSAAKDQFEKYRESGALTALLENLTSGRNISFEQDVSQVVELDGTPVPMRGFPDCYYTTAEEQLVIVDWKCNGYTSNYKKSPSKYFVKEHGTGKSHKKVSPIVERGVLLQKDFCFSETDPKWATQLAIYSWMLGIPVGEAAVGQIEQLLISDSNTRLISYCGYISKNFQQSLAKKMARCWKSIQDKHYFPNLSKEDSDRRVRLIEKKNVLLLDDNPLMRILKNLC